MIREIVRNYEIVQKAPAGEFQFNGTSAALKQVIFQIFADHSPPRSILDIGFGRGELGYLIKSTPSTAHWSIDGIDGFEVTCFNQPLFERHYYRNIWHGYAQDLGSDRLGSYDILCLLDVIEHLDATTARQLLRTLISSLGEHSFLFISTPLWFYPQDNQQAGDLEEHLIGIPASSMLALQPAMYAIGPLLVGNFVFTRRSLPYLDLFQPVEDPGFTMEQGVQNAIQAGMQLNAGILYHVSYNNA